jgi:hypothetical protein
MRTAALLIVAVLGGLLGAAPSTTANDTSPRFTHVDVFIDPHGKPLAAYQFELRAAPGADVKLVGIEGGEHKAFARPPYYDPKALLSERIVIAAFNTGEDLPTTKTRVARLMVRVGAGEPKYDVTLEVAASGDGKKLDDAAVTISQGANP